MSEEQRRRKREGDREQQRVMMNSVKQDGNENVKDKGTVSLTAKRERQRDQK